MRYTCLLLFVLATQSGIGSRYVAAIDIPTKAEGCAAPIAALRLARASGISVGIETLPDECWHRTGSFAQAHVKDAAVQAIANRLSDLDKRYAWTLTPSIVLVRPARVSDEHDYFMTRAVAPFDVTAANIGDALEQISRVFEQRLMRASVDVRALRKWQAVFNEAPLKQGLDPIAMLGWFGHSDTIDQTSWRVVFKGGSFVEALNALVQGPGGGGWIVTYCGDAVNEDDAMILVIIRDTAGRKERMWSLAGASNRCGLSQ